MTQTVSVTIDRSCAQAYEFLLAPENMSLWASGLGASLERAGDEWIVQSPEGPARVRFTDRNAFGVLDHTVFPPDGSEVYVPMRVIANGEGCEVILTLFRQPSMSDARFAADLEWVQRDLETLKTVLEKP